MCKRESVEIRNERQILLFHLLSAHFIHSCNKEDIEPNAFETYLKCSFIIAVIYTDYSPYHLLLQVFPKKFVEIKIEFSILCMKL